MNLGKLTSTELTAIVFPRRGVERREVLVRSGIGQDCAIVDLGGDAIVVSSDPITGATNNAGWLAIHVGCNDVATTGARPVGALVTLLLSPTAPLDDARRIMDDAHRAAEDADIEIVGGHSEITRTVLNSLVIVTVFGRVQRGHYATPAKARAGDTILLTKAAGLEGTAVLATDRVDYLTGRVPLDVLARASEWIREISIVPEALVAFSHGATAMHDATEGGILGALAELSDASHLGVELNLDRVPLRPETRLICDAFRIDPYGLVSSGALVITTPDPDRVVEAVRRIGRPIETIGRLIDGPSRVIRGATSKPLVPPERDVLWAALDAT